MKKIFKLFIFILCMLPVYVFASGITVNPQKVVVNPSGNATFTITASGAAGRLDITSANTNIANVSFQSDNGNSVWLDSNSLEGTANLTVTVNGVSSGSTTINIVINAATYDEQVIKTTKTIQVVVKNRVTFVVDGQNYYSYFEPGETVTYKTDISKAGYELEGYLYNNRLYSLNETLIMPSNNITLTAQWRMITPTIPASTGYVVDNDYIRNIEAAKAANTLNLALDSVYTVRVVNKNDVVKTTGYIATGDKVQIFLSTTKLSEYTVIIKGEINGDGEIDALDYVMIKNHIMGKTYITGDVYLDAADMDANNSIEPLDYVKVKNYIMSH